MLISQKTVIIFSTMFILVACSEERPRTTDEFKFVEYLKVEGTCYENHVKESAPYSGSLRHWHNITNDQHYRSGAVHHEQSDEKRNEKFEYPYRYYPPSSVEFWKIPSEQFTKQEMKLDGISHHLPKGDYQEGAKYEATCTLKVLERLDYNPSIQASPKP